MGTLESRPLTLEDTHRLGTHNYLVCCGLCHVFCNHPYDPCILFLVNTGVGIVLASHSGPFLLFLNGCFVFKIHLCCCITGVCPPYSSPLTEGRWAAPTLPSTQNTTIHVPSGPQVRILGCMCIRVQWWAHILARPPF